LEKHITPKTRGITIVTPGNPLGTTYTIEELEVIHRVAKKYNLFIISDETYMEMVLHGKSHHSALSIRNRCENTILISSFSKSMAISGFRIGFMIVPNGELREFMKVQDTIAICSPHISQLAVLHTLPKLDKFLKPHLSELSKRVEIVENFVNKHRLTWIKPDGGIFCMINFGVQNSLEFVLKLVREAGVIVLPGNSFGDEAEGWIRLSFGSAPRITLMNGLEKLSEYLSS
jgi:aspartate/methionine/tyrosine aminotransferase